MALCCVGSGGAELRRRRRGAAAVTEEEDMDVARERQRVMLGGGSDDVLKIEELTKVPLPCGQPEKPEGCQSNLPGFLWCLSVCL